MFSAETLDDALATLGAVLSSRNHRYDVVAIGGGALHLLGAIKRPTKDLDIVALVLEGELATSKPFPSPLAQACADVARALNLADDWINPGPTDLLTFGLPEGMLARAVRREYGDGLLVRVASRLDQIHFKLYAAADGWPLPNKHLQDLKRLAPRPDELRAAARWTTTHDTSEGYRSLCIAVLEHLGAGASLDDE